MKNNSFSILLMGLLLLALNPSQALQFPFKLSSYSNKNLLIGIVPGLALSYMGYQFFIYFQAKSMQYLEDAIANKAVETIAIALMPMSWVERLPKQEQEEILIKKAKLIVMRKKVLASLQELLDDTSAPLSIKQRKNIQRNLNYANVFFITIDAVRKENKFEKQYEQLALLDSFIEKQIINSIVLTSKPDKECSVGELAQKQVVVARRNHIIAKLTTRVEERILVSLKKIPWLLDIF